MEFNRALQLLEKSKDIVTVYAPVKNKRKERSVYELPALEYMSYKYIDCCYFLAFQIGTLFYITYPLQIFS